MPSLKKQITCLHCWHKFPPEDILWQSVHRELLGDSLLGENAQLRFLPLRFNLHGNALDARGQICRELACPKCHLPLFPIILEREPIFVSILGSPSCGKSFYLAALSTKLRRELPQLFKLDFSDADSISNQSLVDYEEKLFLNNNPDQQIPLGDLIIKTQLQGDLYNTVQYGSQTISYPRPFSFLLSPVAGHPNAGKQNALRRVLCLYDNAGEHFLPGHDQASAPGTRHMAESSFLMFMFDPTQDPRWHAAMRQCSPELEVPKTPHRGRQEGILREAATRIQKLRGLADGEKHDRPLIVILNKVDVWRKMLPWEEMHMPISETNYGVHGIDMTRLEMYSQALRGLLAAHVPEIIFAAESFFSTVYYVPVSALGTPPQFNSTGQATIRPADIHPWWVSVPFMLGLSLTTKGLIATCRANTNGHAART